MNRNFMHFNIDEIHDNLLLGEEITHHELLTAVIGLCGEIKLLKEQIMFLKNSKIIGLKYVENNFNLQRNNYDVNISKKGK